MAMISRFVSVATLGLLCAFSSVAGIVNVVNFSFEDLGGGLPVGCGANCSYTTGAINGWTKTGSGAAGEMKPGMQAGQFFYFSSFSTPTDGITIGFSNGATLSQTVVSALTIQAGATYTLMVDVGHRNDLPVKGSADLLITGTNGTTVVLAGNGNLPVAPGGWSTFTATYTALPGDQTITIQLLSSGPSRAQGDFDNVRLTFVPAGVAPAPEPAGVTLLGLGLGGLLLFARRNRAC
jgi:hypothetical protein